MKKLFLVAAVMLLMAIQAKARDIVSAPQGGNEALATADYGGVDYSTMCFSTKTVFVGSGEYLVYGVIFSSIAPSCTIEPFIVIMDTASMKYSVQGPKSDWDVISVNMDSSTLSNYGANGWRVFFDYPVIMRKGLAWRGSAKLIEQNITALLYWKRR